MSFNMDDWEPKTNLGKEVKAGNITDIDTGEITLQNGACLHIPLYNRVLQVGCRLDHGIGRNFRKEIRTGRNRSNSTVICRDPCTTGDDECGNKCAAQHEKMFLHTPYSFGFMWMFFHIRNRPDIFHCQ